MFKLILENEQGLNVDLTNGLDYVVDEVDGLYPPSATIATSELALYDGAKFNSSKVNTRQLDISVKIQRNAEQNRMALYKVIRSKHYIKMYYKNGMRDVFIEGYVTDFNVDLFAMKQTATITILCPEPYFKEASEIIDDIAASKAMFTFPFAIKKTEPIPISTIEDLHEINIINEGDVESGMIIEISASGDVINPTIYNRDTTEYFGLNTTLQANDVVYINTQRGSKSVRLYRDGEYTNIFNSIRPGSTWLQLQPSDNVFRFEGDSETTLFMRVRFTHQHMYEGV